MSDKGKYVFLRCPCCDAIIRYYYEKGLIYHHLTGHRDATKLKVIEQ